ncbi:MAG: hypothetical protein ACOVO2_05195 [Emticicia sp.]|uniref:hypothetical protein n=1 Tax=Emticicia sp. TaxID=1930953 RepID=UPI003BA8317E
MKSKIYCVGILGVIMACLGKQEPSELLKKANEIHVASVKLQEEIENDLDSLKKLPELKIQADSLAEVLENWEASLIEIEGFEHEHKHGEHHHHKHSPAPDMTDEQMLEYQQNTKSEIIELRESVLKLKSKK